MDAVESSSESMFTFTLGSTCSVAAQVTSTLHAANILFSLATNYFELSTKVTMSAREDIAASAPVWVADRHEDDWTATVGSEPGVMTECCTDGVTILSKMNPGKLQMPIGVRACSLRFAGLGLTTIPQTRVICIKTQHLNNLHIAMQHSTWITADKVGEKINRVYEDHSPEAGEKVLFIFSINRQRAFCALAEMNGPWVQGESRLSGWQEVAGSFNIVG